MKRKVWYYAKADQIYIQPGQTMYTVYDDVTVTFLIDSVKDWSNFIYLGEL